MLKVRVCFFMGRCGLALIDAAGFFCTWAEGNDVFTLFFGFKEHVICDVNEAIDILSIPGE